MNGYQERQNTVTVPSNTGVEGFLKTLRTILSLPRVQRISIDATGKVQYTRYVQEGEPDGPIQVDYSGLEPWSIIRNSASLEEIPVAPNALAPMVIAGMFNILSQEGLVPIAFATGTASHFWQWHARSGVNLARRSSAYGIPIYVDQNMPDYALVLCAAYVRTSLLDCHRFIMVGMQVDDFLPPETRVNVL